MVDGFVFEYIGLKSYGEVLEMQEAYFNLLLDEKSKNGKSSSPDKMFLCQHLPVYTLGKNGDESNLLPQAKQSGAEFFHTSRGGDITYHGPGQLVGYPIIDLERMNIGLAKYIENIEQVIIEVLNEYGITGKRLEKASGVWLDVGDPAKVRKICALGIRSSRFVTMHGFAFNINTDLSYFNHINPCGFTDKGVTSMQKELGEKQYFMHITERVINRFKQVFDLNNTQLILPLQRND
ncbi:MAG TPA: lipoate--protein ligase [Flavobacteriales bacterium]|nr:lipoate--protein ligase [Flavobacteriales bacterium]